MQPGTASAGAESRAAGQQDIYLTLHWSRNIKKRQKFNLLRDSTLGQTGFPLDMTSVDQCKIEPDDKERRGVEAAPVPHDLSPMYFIE